MASSFTEATWTLDYPCEECPKSSSLPLLNSHRCLLREEMTKINAEQNQFENILDQQSNNPELHPLVKQINEWEKESIEKIQQRAQELRQRLFQLITAHIRQLSHKVQELSEQLIDGQTYDTFIETDLRRSKQIQNDLKANLTSPSTITIGHLMSTPLVQNIYVVSTATNELFLQTFDNKVRIEENGQLAIHDTSIDTTEIRGRNVYTTGCHKIRLRIEQSNNKWTFIGINSKLIPLQNQSHSCSSSYGWTSNHTIWSNGQPKSSLPIKPVDMKNGDIISFIIDCDKFFIMMINERSAVKHELTVNVDNCPLPWQLHVVLHEPNSRIRVLRE